jgi:Na+-translocating ferredoxin:NAD+ oxidoreductase RnfD subunit
MSKPKEYSYMTKDKLMLYTFVALLVLTIITIVSWSQVTPINMATQQTMMNLGLTLALNTLIAVGVAVGVDALLHKIAADSQLNIMSSAVFGLIVALSYSLGAPGMAQATDIIPIDLLTAPACFTYVAFISLVGQVVFKKVVGLSGRKIVNPAAAAKMVVLLPFLFTAFLAKDHYASYLEGGLSVPQLAGPIGNTLVGTNGLASFSSYLQSCYANPAATTYPDLNQLMILEKFHGWPGGASSLAVIIVGIALFVIARRYIKWRITLAYFATVAIMSILMSVAFADVDMTTRLVFEIFMGSSIFLGFFMATDPASTPLSYSGQLAFGVGVGVLTVLIQTYMNFFGGSLLALLIMNIVTPQLDKIGKLKPMTESREPKLPRAKQFAPETIKEYQCIRCGACMRVCCHRLSPILIKQAFDKMNFDALMKLHADYCTGCGHCTFVCPARIDLRKSVLMSKSQLRGQQ